MTEQEKDVVANVLFTHDITYNQARQMLEEIEAKLSPKYPLAEAICEVWDDVGDGNHYYRYGRQAPGWDHYRRIVTAEEALEWMDEECKHGGTPGVMEMYHWLRDGIRRLIDNAERG